MNINNKLETEINNFIKWCQKKDGVYDKTVEGLIEKMTIWYELRFPDGDINKEFPCMLNNATSDAYLDDIDFIRDYLKIATKEEKEKITDVFGLVSWADIFSTKQFISKLSYGEKEILKPSFPRRIDINKMTSFGKKINRCFYLTEEGRILREMGDFIPGIELPSASNIKDAYHDLKENKFYSYKDLNELKLAIDSYDTQVQVKTGVLNSVMYKLILKNRLSLGPKRAFKFAKEFDLDTKIPFIYGLTSSPYGTKDFINQGLQNGLTTDTMCYYTDYEYGEYYTKLMSIEDVLNKEVIKDEENLPYAAKVNSKTLTRKNWGYKSNKEKN